MNNELDNTSTVVRTHWSDKLADRVLEAFPDKDVYTFAAGISPSGVIHFGNFRDVITTYAVAERLQSRGKQVRVLFSWDDFDRFRKVPAGIDPSYEQYIATKLSSIPAPDGKHKSYAEQYEKEFEASMAQLDIKLEYLYQTELYQSGTYDELILEALKKREIIANILLSFMPEKTKEQKGIVDEEYRANYYPISVYSRFTGKDKTRVLDYDGESTITYKCLETGNVESVDLTKERIAKLSWKTDWAMRWKFEGVVFEPGGRDHSTPGGSYDTSSLISQKVYDNQPPLFEGYDFVGIQGLGSKMSGSKGNSVSPGKLLEIYTPQMLKWMYFSRPPKQSFELSFDKAIYKQYSEFDNLVEQLRQGTIKENDRVSLELSGITEAPALPDIPFRQAVGFGQIIHWNEEKLRVLLEKLELQYNPDSIANRLACARNWLVTYNKDEAFGLLSHVNTDYVNAMSTEQKQHINKLREFLQQNPEAAIADIEQTVYAIPKQPDYSLSESAKAQRAFFKDVYNLLIGSDVGPRLSTFLWAAERERILDLLDIEQS